MASNKELLEILKAKLKEIKIQHNVFFSEIKDLQERITNLEQSINRTPDVVIDKKVEKETPVIADRVKSNIKQPIPATQVKKKPKESKPLVKKEDLESFIGTNLIAKIGVLIMVIGVAIGGKYAIDNNLISPLTRIILGYVFGIGLTVVALKLKEKYESFSAVLLSGAMAIFYFITYFAYSLYGLFPQSLTFILMLVFTVFTVLAAIHYKKQMIAILGLVGAYAIPFFLSNDSGNVLVLFSYMTIVNIGIMFVAFKQYWKPLYYISFGFTWLIYSLWLVDDYSESNHFLLALLFGSIFFIIFYATFLTYKLIKKEEFNTGDFVLLLLNSFVFYGLGYYLLSEHETGQYLLGIFTVFNAVIHFAIGTIVYKKSKQKEGLFYTIFGLVMLFLTIAVPVQLDGNWVTLFWVGEAALLYWIGATKDVDKYKKMAYPLLAIASISLFDDWQLAYERYGGYINPIFNIQFLSSLLFVGALAFMNYIYYKFVKEKNIIVSLIFGILLFLITYKTFYLEISNYFDFLNYDFKERTKTTGGYYYYDYKRVWLLNYTLFFLSIFSFMNIKKLKATGLGNINVIFNAILIVAFLTVGLYSLSDLRQSFLHDEYDFVVTSNAIGLRYVSLLFFALLVFMTYLYTKQEYIHHFYKEYFKLFLVSIILWLLSSELLHWLDLAGVKSQYKLSLSILWGCYGLLLVAYGIWKRYKLIRISGIAVFGITLIKLFFYDIAHLSTISKTIVFISLGMLLLIMSFLYNKYTSIISNDDDKE